MKRAKKNVSAIVAIAIMTTSITTVPVSAHVETVDSVIDMVESMLKKCDSELGYMMLDMDATIISGDYTTDVVYLTDAYFEHTADDDITYLTSVSSVSSGKSDWYSQNDVYTIPSENGYHISNYVVSSDDEGWRYADASFGFPELKVNWTLDDEICEMNGYYYYILSGSTEFLDIELYVDTEIEVLRTVHIEASGLEATEEVTSFLTLYDFDASYDSFLINDMSFDLGLSYNAVESIDLPEEATI